MHYKNGRPVEIGDFVVGTSHNSGGRIIFAIVLEEMPLQGNCNIRLAPIKIVSREHAEKLEVSYLPLSSVGVDGGAVVRESFDDYGDAKNFLKCEDGLRFAKAAQYAAWDSPYFV